jgi:hypothetical protein
MHVPPFSVTDKPPKMKENEKSHFSILLGLSMPSSLRDRLAPFKIAPCNFVVLWEFMDELFRGTLSYCMQTT